MYAFGKFIVLLFSASLFESSIEGTPGWRCNTDYKLDRKIK